MTDMTVDLRPSEERNAEVCSQAQGHEEFSYLRKN